MLHLVVALRAEARPLIEHFRLTRDLDAAPFELYRGDQMTLVVSGMGKLAAATAVGWMAALSGGAPAAWLNVGIAGHGTRRVGESILAHAVVDRATGAIHYPALVFDPHGPTDRVLTVDAVERHYTDDGAFDMEASGFAQAAARFASAELVHCLKIISDGPEAPPETLTKARLGELVGGHLERVAKVAAQLAELADEARRLAAPPAELDLFLGRWHFTVTERRQLRRLLERWWTLRPAGSALEAVADDASVRRGKDVLAALRRELEASALVVEA